MGACSKISSGMWRHPVLGYETYPLSYSLWTTGEGLSGCHAQTCISLLLQAGQVMRQRRLLHILFLFHGKDRTAAFALQSGPGFFGILFPFIPERTCEKNFLPVLADSGPQMVTAHGHKIPVLKITAADQCQRGCLHPSERVVAYAGDYPQGDARVHAQYPVRFPACPRRQGKVCLLYTSDAADEL